MNRPRPSYSLPALRPHLAAGLRRWKRRRWLTHSSTLPASRRVYLRRVASSMLRCALRLKSPNNVPRQVRRQGHPRSRVPRGARDKARDDPRTWQCGSDDRLPLTQGLRIQQSGCRLRASTSSGGEWAVRDGAMAGWHDARYLQWATIGGAQQPGNLRAQRNTVIDHGHADTCHCYLVCN